MKRNHKPLLSLALTCLLLFSGVQQAFAFQGACGEPLTQACTGSANEAIARDADGQESIVLMESLDLDNWDDQITKATFLAPSSDGSFYAQLSTAGKNCYREMQALSADVIKNGKQQTVNGQTYHSVNFPVSGITGTRMSGQTANGVFTPDESGTAVRNRVRTDIATAWLALSYDCPDALWLRSIVHGYTLQTVPGGPGLAEITAVTIGFYLEFGGREWDMLAEMHQAVEEIVQTCTAPDRDRFTNLKAVHDYLLDHNEYEHRQEDPLSHTPYSALITTDDHLPVCDGYSGAFKLICDKLNIPCTVAVSVSNNPGHMWNNVKMDDGLWYHADLTWNDTGANPDSYFLVGNKTTIGGTMFDATPDHQEADLSSMLTSPGLLPVSFRYPVKSDIAYEYIGGPKFPDVQQGDWYYDWAMQAAAGRLFSGDSEGRFRPNASITRAEFAKVLANLLEADLQFAGINSGFTDVAPGKWYASVVTWASQSGLIQGDGSGRFRPNDPITRQEMCVILSRLHDGPLLTCDVPFLDEDEIADWAWEAVQHCAALGVVRGDKGKALPKSTASRAEAAAVFVRYAQQGVAA